MKNIVDNPIVKTVYAIALTIWFVSLLAAESFDMKQAFLCVLAGAGLAACGIIADRVRCNGYCR